MQARDYRLQGLSHDHHHALVLARRARRADEHPETERAALWSEICARFATELEPHFRIEEMHLFPPLREVNEDDLVELALEQHEALRTLVKSVEPQLHEFGVLLDEHVRYEERTLFPRAQDVLPPAALNDIAEAWGREEGLM